MHAVNAGSNSHHVFETGMEWPTSTISGRTFTSSRLPLGQDLGSGYILSSRVLFLCSWANGA